MDETGDMNNQCPPFAELSAWFDKENTEDFQKHISNCKECQDIIDCFTSYDNSVTENNLEDEARNLRIRQRSIEEIRREKTVENIIPFPIWIKIAASFMLIGTVVFLMQKTNSIAPVTNVANIPVTNKADINFVNQQDKEVEKVEMHSFGDVSAGVQTVKSDIASTSKAKVQFVKNETVKDAFELSKKRDESTQRGFDIGETELVGYGVKGVNIPRKRSSKIVNISSDTINDYVHHVWVVNDPGLPLQSLKPILPNHQGVLEKLINQDQDRYHLQFKIVDRNLKNLVDHFDELGFELVRPDMPQPGPTGDAIYKDKYVHYDVDFVKK